MQLQIAQRSQEVRRHFVQVCRAASLDKSLKKFDEGVQLARFCNEQLEEARTKVELLLEKNGEIEAVPFAEDESGHQDLSE